MIDRRTFVDALAALGLFQALAACAQLPGKRFRIDVLGVRTPEGTVAVTEPFELAMREFGYMDGGRIAHAYRWARGQMDQLPALAADLLQVPLDLIAVGTHAAIAAARSVRGTRDPHNGVEQRLAR